MQRLFASRGTAAAVVGVLAVFAAGGGYALASGSGAKTIHACIHRHGGDIYSAKKCAKHDKPISWNKVGPQGRQGPQGKTGLTGGQGPQGPGATSVDFSTAGSASPSTVTIGKAGPLTTLGICTTTGTGASATTQFVVNYTGPALQVDGFLILPSGTSVPYSQITPATTTGHLGTVGPTSSDAIESAQLLVLPSGGAPIELMVTAVANGGSPVDGATPDTCHLSAAITPVAAPSASATR